MDLLTFGLLLALQPPPDEVAREDVARTHYRQNRFPEAAAAFEALWNLTKTPKYLYNAGLAREGMGHDAHAILHWQRFLTLPGISDKERAKAETKLKEASLRTSSVTIHVNPPDAIAGATLTLLRADGSSIPLEVDLPDLTAVASDRKWLNLEVGTWTITLKPGPLHREAFQDAKISLTVTRSQPKIGAVIQLTENLATLEISLTPRRVLRSDASLTLREISGRHHEISVPVHSPLTRAQVRAGRWEYVARATGFRAKQAPVVLAVDQTARLTLRLERDISPTQLRERNARIGLGAGLGVPGLGLGIGGAVFLAAERSSLTSSPCHDGPCTQGEGVNYTNDFNHKSIAIGLLGSAGGLLAGAVSGVVKAPKQVWWAELGIGAVFFAAGTTTLGVASSLDTSWTMSADKIEISTALKSQHMALTAGALLTGLGAGLALSAASALIVHRRSANRSLRALRRHSIHFSGATLQGAF